MPAAAAEALARHFGRLLLMRSSTVLAVFALAAASCVPKRGASNQGPSPAPADTGIFALLAKVDDWAAYDLWPGFNPTAYPVAVFDGKRTFLFRHPAPPAEFSPVPGRDGVWTYAGRHPSVVANTSAELAEVRVATGLRRERFALLPAGAVAYERGTELNEGLAAYIERRTTGAHPLFTGVRSLTITGREDEPAIETTDGVTTLSAEGIDATLRGAAVARAGRTITVRLRR